MGNIMDELKEHEVTAEVEKPKPYQFRRLKSKDVFLMTKIIGKIGINNIKGCLNNDSIASVIAKAKGDDGVGADTTMIGISVTLDIANILFNNLDKCENEIYRLLSQTSDLDTEAIEDMDMPVFLEMIIDFVKKEEFADFFGVALKLFK